MGGLLRGVEVSLAEFTDIFFRTKDGSDDQFVWIQSLGGKGILEIPADAVQQVHGGGNQVRDRMGEFLHMVQVVVRDFHQFPFHMFRRLSVLDRRNADGLGHGELDLVQVVEFLGKLDVVNPYRMILDGACMEPSPIPYGPHDPGDKQHQDQRGER